MLPWLTYVSESGTQAVLVHRSMQLATSTERGGVQLTFSAPYLSGTQMAACPRKSEGQEILMVKYIPCTEWEHTLVARS